MAQRQATLNLVFVTDGGASHPRHPIVTPADIAKRRKDEAHEATGILGVNWEHVTFLGIRDGTVSHLDERQGTELEARIAALIERLAPDAILLPCRGDGSSEHDAVFLRVARAIGKTGLKTRVLEFPVWSWWNPLLMAAPILSCRNVWRVDFRPVRNLKGRAITSYASQTLPIPPETNPALPPGFAGMFLGGDEYFFEW